MKRKFISILLVFLFITSVTIPTVTAEPIPAAAVGVVAAAPETAELIIGGITVVVSGATVIEIGKQLGKTWNGVAENWDRFVKDVSAGIDNLLHAKRWIKVTSQEGKEIMTAVYECFDAGGSSGGKKDDKWYFEARLNHGKIEFNLDRMNEEQAVKEMGRGKDIMTLDEELAQKVVERYEGKPREKIEFEISHETREGFYEHLNYEAHDMRLHCWVWRKA